MLGSSECLERAAMLERQAARASNRELRVDYLKAAEGWRDLARRAEEIERREAGAPAPRAAEGADRSGA